MKHQLEDCVFREIRKLSIEERIRYINTLNSAEKLILIQKHKDCLADREKNIPFSRIAIF